MSHETTSASGSGARAGTDRGLLRIVERRVQRHPNGATELSRRRLDLRKRRPAPQGVAGSFFSGPSARTAAAPTAPAAQTRAAALTVPAAPTAATPTPPAAPTGASDPTGIRDAHHTLNWTPGGNLAILARSVPAVVGADGAH